MTRTFSRRRLLVATLAAVTPLALSGLGLNAITAQAASPNPNAVHPVLNVVTTIFPPFDFVRAIGGDRVAVSLLLKPGQEAHTFEPTPADVKRIQAADLFIYTGGENDTWVEGLLDSLGDKSPQTVRLIDLVPTLAEEVVEGMEDDDDGHDHDHDHDHEAERDHQHDGHTDEHNEQSEQSAEKTATAQSEPTADTTSDASVNASSESDVEPPADAPDHHGESTTENATASSESAEDDDPPADEHVWMSPKNAEAIVTQLAALLGELDPAGKVLYDANAKVYNEQLNRLDKDFLDMVAYAPRKTILVGDRFPFRYLAARYGLHYYAAFPGCSAQTRPSAATLAFLVKKTRDEKLPIIFRVAGSSSRIAQAIAEPAGSKVLVLHALHNLSPDEMRRGETYLTLMRANLNALKTALYA